MESPLERFAIPHTFQPRLTLYGAFLSVMANLTQILVGCLIAALWGVRIWLTAASAQSIFWKSLSISGSTAGLVASLAILIWAVQTIVRRLS